MHGLSQHQQFYGLKTVCPQGKAMATLSEAQHGTSLQVPASTRTCWQQAAAVLYAAAAGTLPVMVPVTAAILAGWGRQVAIGARACPALAASLCHQIIV